MYIHPFLLSHIHNCGEMFFVHSNPAMFSTTFNDYVVASLTVCMKEMTVNDLLTSKNIKYLHNPRKFPIIIPVHNSIYWGQLVKYFHNHTFFGCYLLIVINSKYINQNIPLESFGSCNSRIHQRYPTFHQPSKWSTVLDILF
jgi:hypothetical protein